MFLGTITTPSPRYSLSNQKLSGCFLGYQGVGPHHGSGQIDWQNGHAMICNKAFTLNQRDSRLTQVCDCQEGVGADLLPALGDAEFVPCKVFVETIFKCKDHCKAVRASNCLQCSIIVGGYKRGRVISSWKCSIGLESIFWLINQQVHRKRMTKIRIKRLKYILPIWLAPASCIKNQLSGG